MNILSLQALLELDDEQFNKALEEAVKKGEITEKDLERIMSRITYSTAGMAQD